MTAVETLAPAPIVHRPVSAEAPVAPVIDIRAPFNGPQAYPNVSQPPSFEPGDSSLQVPQIHRTITPMERKPLQKGAAITITYVDPQTGKIDD